MEAGTLAEWLVKPGDWVKRGDIVAVVETQKGAIEIEIFETGQIEQILIDLGSTVPVGVPLARIRTEIEAQAEIPAAPPSVERIGAIQPAPPSGQTLTAPVQRQTPRAAPVPGVDHVRVSPAARRFAQTRSVDLSGISGTGPGGAILRADVERHLSALKEAPARKRAVGLDLDGMRAAIAAAMARSKREIPHYYLEHQIDVTGCEHWLTQTNASRSPETCLLMGALAVKAVALAARRFPAFNGFYRDAQYQPAAAVHVGVAIAIRGGRLAASALH
jgi:pyruvate dehydrogenase E2 component (dihydrolipoamide acetyltransferase)